MNVQRTVHSLSRLVELRAIEVDRLERALAGQLALRRRYEHNLQRMEHLLDTTASSDMACPVLSSNSAHYKASLIDLIGRHRRELADHDRAIDGSKAALRQAMLRHEGLDRSLQDKRRALQREHKAREQKRQDQLATQAWSRHRFHHATS